MSVQGSNMYEKYFRLFEGNAAKKQRYQVILSTGEVFSGVPDAAQGTTKTDSFTVSLDSGSNFNVEWSRLLQASPL